MAKILNQIASDENRMFESVKEWLSTSNSVIDGLSDLHERFCQYFASTKFEQLTEFQTYSLLNCFQSMRYQFVLGSLALYRAHGSDSASYGRKAIELAAFCIEIFKTPDSADRWLKHATSKSAMDKYLSRFPAYKLVRDHKDVLTKELVSRYDEYCLFVHPSYGSLFRQVELTEDRRHLFSYFDIEDHDDFVNVVGQIFILCDTHTRILVAMTELLQSHATTFPMSEWLQLLADYAVLEDTEKEKWAPAIRELARKSEEEAS